MREREVREVKSFFGEKEKSDICLGHLCCHSAAHIGCLSTFC